MKKTLTILTFVVLLCAGYWFFIKPILFGQNVPTNPPTAEEVERMKEIERSSSQLAPNAVPGAGVRPVGSLPPTPPASEESAEVTSSSSPEALPL